MFDRVLSRMASTNNSGWMVTGGVALDLRIGEGARPTQDLDLAISGTSTEVDNSIVDALNAELDDFFNFYVKNTPSIVDKPAALTMSFQIRAELAGRRFEDISIDVGALLDANTAIELIGDGLCWTTPASPEPLFRSFRSSSISPKNSMLARRSMGMVNEAHASKTSSTSY
jgi:hypothetical protein